MDVDDEREPSTSQNAQTDGDAMEDTTGEAETPRDDLGDRARPSVVLMTTFGQVRETKRPNKTILLGRGSKDDDVVPPVRFERTLDGF